VAIADCKSCFWHEQNDKASACFNPLWDPRSQFDMNKHCDYKPIIDPDEEVAVRTICGTLMRGKHGNLGTCPRMSGLCA